MDCPKCGFVLIEDRWICENCGAEIQIVPDFELELENSISEVLLHVADEINPQRKETVAQAIEEEVTKEEDAGQEKQLIPITNKLKRYLIIASSIFVFLVLAIPSTIAIYRNNSAPYQISQAKAYEAAGDYGQAILRMAKANSIRPNDAEIKLLWAAYCFSDEDYDQALEILLEMIHSPRFTWAEKDICYANIIIIWHMMGKYQEINDLLLASRDEDLIAEYQHYLSSPPIFSEGPGEYTGKVSLALTSEAEGKIYFTLDGSEPTKDSLIYKEPILLDGGDFQIAAVFENEFGILSEIVLGNFTIGLLIPESPIVPLTSGRYIEQTQIIVEALEDYEVYYTIDGSDPTIESELYLEPIEMALGVTEYRFVAVDPNGHFSDIVSREFEFRLNSEITLEMAVANVITAQVRRGRIVDISGKATEEEGYYEYLIDSLIEIEDKGLYYMIIEYYYESGEKPQRTGHIFAASVYTGEAVHLIYNDVGVLDAVRL